MQVNPYFPPGHGTVQLVSNFPMVDVVAAACQNGHYSTQWRTSLAIGCVFPVVIFVLRLFIKEPEEFRRNSMRHTKTPYGLVFRFYGLRLLAVSLIWFIYDVRLASNARGP